MTACMEPLFDALGIDGAVVSYNGAMLRSPRATGRALVMHRPLGSDMVALLIAFAEELHAACLKSTSE